MHISSGILLPGPEVAKPSKQKREHSHSGPQMMRDRGASTIQVYSLDAERSACDMADLAA